MTEWRFPTVEDWLRGRSARERAGLALVAAAASVWLAVSAHEMARRLEDAAVQTSRSAAEARAARDKDNDASYHALIKERSDTAMAFTITEASAGVAQARAVSAARAAALEAGLTNVDVAADATAKDGSVSVTLSADFSWNDFGALLEELRRSDVAFGIAEIAVTPDGESNKRMELRLRAPFVRSRGGA